MTLNEADTRAKLIDPKLRLAGWGESKIEREHFFEKGKEVTDGKIYLVGDQGKRKKPQIVDYLLRFKGEMIAVVEAKDESKSPDAGLGQAKNYADKLQIPFAYSTNGHSFIEFDFLENKSREIDNIPPPEKLIKRWNEYRELNKLVKVNRASARGKDYTAEELDEINPLTTPFCPESVCGKSPRYYQEIAIRRVIERIVDDQDRILLTMATGTGKTYTAFQIVWKLKKSNWLKKPVLFIADRNILRDQAYNAFGPFRTDDADPRSIIEKGEFNANRELYFSIYQALDAEQDGEPLFKKIPKDFFGLIIIDECHRSGFGKWNEILQHFPDAIQLGMTATPKQDENIDTYAYFCSEEPEVAIDPENPEKGTWHPPAFSYSLGQGIEDGFLANYKVHRVRTSVDKGGLVIDDAYSQGAEIYVPEEMDLKDVYHTPQFEREITVPDRTEAIVSHLANLLRKFGPDEKAMIFCVDIEHARLVARLLQNEFSDLGMSNYAVPIVSEEYDSDAWLRRFQDSDRREPVVATTAELLSTGVDVPSCKNIVFIKPISSRVLFKQIIGRGSRVDSITEKLWFRIIDYVGATRLFDEWDRPPSEPEDDPSGPYTCGIKGTVTHAESGDLIVGASASLQVSINNQMGPVYTDDEGTFSFEELPVNSMKLSVRANGFNTRSVTIQTEPDVTQNVAIELKPEKAQPEKIKVRGLEINIADEATFLVEETGEQLNLNEYLDYTKQKIVGYVPEWAKLHEVWTDPSKRSSFLSSLEESSVHAEVLSKVLELPAADQYDLLAHIAFDRPVRTRNERAEAFKNQEQEFINQYGKDAQNVILSLLDKYRLAGINEITNPEVFRLSPFREMGKLPGIIDTFGGKEKLKSGLLEMQERLYNKRREITS